MKKYLILVFCLTLIISSCKSVEFYREQVVEKARAYALKGLKSLPENKRNYLMHAPPYLIEERLIVRDSGAVSVRDIMQTCVVWDIPGLNKDVVVCGVSSKRLNDWDPIRLVMKNYIKVDSNKVAAISKARDYAIQKMQYLSNKVRDRIRFSAPELIFKSSYDIDTSVLEEELTEAATKKDLKAPEFNFVQYSLVWNSDKLNEKVVITGVVNQSPKSKDNDKNKDQKEEKRELGGWKALFGTLRPSQEVPAE